MLTIPLDISCELDAHCRCRYYLLGVFNCRSNEGIAPDNLVVRFGEEGFVLRGKSGFHRSSIAPLFLWSGPGSTEHSQTRCFKRCINQFLVSTPETGADSVAMTYAMMGWPLAVIRPVAAVTTA